jgi:hypothetical protein
MPCPHTVVASLHIWFAQHACPAPPHATTMPFAQIWPVIGLVPSAMHDALLQQSPPKQRLFAQQA